MSRIGPQDEAISLLRKIHEQGEKTQEDVAAVVKWINGNGHPGAKTRIALLEDYQARETKWRWATITMLLGVVGAWLASWIKS